MTDVEAEIKASLERIRDEGALALMIYMLPGQSPRYAGPHITADQLDAICLAVMKGYRDAMRPRAVN